MAIYSDSRETELRKKRMEWRLPPFGRHLRANENIDLINAKFHGETDKSMMTVNRGSSTR